MDGRASSRESTASRIGHPLSRGMLGLALAAGATSLLVLALLVGRGWGSTANSDITADWLVRAAARDGIDSRIGVRELAGLYGVDYVGEASSTVATSGRVHPRTPGALLVLTPLLLAEPGSLVPAFLVINGVFTAGLMAVTVGVVGEARRAWSVALLPLIPATLPVLRAFEFGAHSIILAVAVWVFVLATRDRDRAWPGVLLGVAIAVRLFPALLMFPALAGRRWKASAAAGATATGLTVWGLLLPGVSMEQTIGVLRTASNQWAGVGFGGSISAVAAAMGIPVSASAIGSAAIGVVGATVIALRVKDYQLAFAACLILAVLASPLSWVHYDVLLIPAVFLVLFADGRGAWGRILASLTVAGWLLGKMADHGAVDMALRGSLLFALPACEGGLRTPVTRS